MQPAADTGARWFAPALALVAAVTALRLVVLSFNRTDLFVDESQYWLWGQNLDFGYYSKPPLIGWVIRAVTDLAGSDTPFWVRAPGAVLHGATALILGALAAGIWGARVAFWTALSYVTVPFATVGSLLISTDTVLAPAYAAGLLLWFQLARCPGRPLLAVGAGLAIGVAFLAKYTAFYFLPCALLAALVDRDLRVGWRNAALFLAAFALAISPNVVWNLTHDLTTVSHTMDNVGWVREDSAARHLNPAGLVSFFLSQFGVAGPVLFAGLIAALVSPRVPHQRAFLALSIPVLLVVCVQALLSKAYANWALAAYFAGLPLAVAWLLSVRAGLMHLSLLVNGLIAVALPLLTALAPWPESDGAPLLKRYLGRADLTAQIVAAAQLQHADAIYAADRNILADLFYNAANAELRIYAPRPTGRPHNYYEQMFPLPETAGNVFYVLAAPPVCNGIEVAPAARFDTARGAYDKASLAGYVLPDGCGDVR